MTVALSVGLSTAYAAAPPNPRIRPAAIMTTALAVDVTCDVNALCNISGRPLLALAYLCLRAIPVLRSPSHPQTRSTLTIARLLGESLMFLPSLRIASRSAAVSLAAALLACVTLSANAATTASHRDIVVVTVHGSVTATMTGMTVPLSGGAILQLPATVRTGADGAVELRQGTSTFAAAGNTELEI